MTEFRIDRKPSRSIQRIKGAKEAGSIRTADATSHQSVNFIYALVQFDRRFPFFTHSKVEKFHAD